MTELQQLEYDNQVIKRFSEYHFVEDVEQDPVFDQLQAVFIRHTLPKDRQRLEDALDALYLIKTHLEDIQIQLHTELKSYLKSIIRKQNDTTNPRSA